MTILVTGTAGFIGFHLCKSLLDLGEEVIGLDNLNDYYDINLKLARLKILKEIDLGSFKFFKGDMADKKFLNNLFNQFNPRKVVNLAAQAGVRHSINNPESYIQSNLVGFLNLIECCRHFKVNHFIYASSSSVYGGNTKMPFSENQSVDHPVSLYAATKKSNELIAHSYSHLYDIPSTGLRFFTVYGPWGRPDMALFLFTKAIIEGKPIEVYNNGNMIRDFTYIDDIVQSLLRVIKQVPEGEKNFDKNNPDPSNSWAPHKIFNIGNSCPTPLMTFINAIENALNKKANKIYLPIQPGDVPATSANTDSLEKWINYKPNTPVIKGVMNFVNWYKNFYKISID